MGQESYHKNRHSCYLLEYHFVAVTKYRYPVIQGRLKERLIELTHTIFEENWPCTIIEVNTDRDHIHILFESQPQVQLSALVNNYKTVSSRLLRKEFAEELSIYYWKPVFWSQSYFIASVSDRSTAAVKEYIKNQKIKEEKEAKKAANPS